MNPRKEGSPWNVIKAARLRNLKHWGWRVQCLRAIAALAEDSVLIPNTSMAAHKLSVISFPGLFWPPWTIGINGMHIHTCI